LVASVTCIGIAGGVVVNGVGDALVLLEPVDLTDGLL